MKHRITTLTFIPKSHKKVKIKLLIVVSCSHVKPGSHYDEYGVTARYVKLRIAILNLLSMTNFFP